MWLRSFKLQCIKQIKKWPFFDAMVTDFCYPEIFAVLEIFNGMDLIEYLNHTYKCITENNVDNFSEKYVKLYLCCSHMTHNMYRDVNNVVDKGSDPSRILKQILASMFLTNSYDKIIKIWTYLCRIMNSKYVSSATQESIAAIIMEAVEFNSIIDSTYDKCDENIDGKRDFSAVMYKQSPYYKDCARILKNTEDPSNETGPVNALYAPAFLELFLKKYITYLPMWSGILKKIEKRHSNSHVENYWRILKDRLNNEHSIGKFYSFKLFRKK